MNKAQEYDLLLREMNETKAVSTQSLGNAFAAARALNAVIEWEEANRDLIAHALRMLEASENPSREMLTTLSQAFAKTRSRFECGHDMLDEEKAMLCAFREAVK